MPAMLKTPVVLPAAISTLGGSFTMPLGTAESVTSTPPAGAGVLRFRFPFIVRVKPTVPDGNVIETLGGATLIVAEPEEKPGADAVTLLMPMTSPATTVMFAPTAFSGTVAIAGTVANCELLVERYTTSSPGPAGAGSIIVSVPV